jgi:hypothetical protein
MKRELGTGISSSPIEFQSRKGDFGLTNDKPTSQETAQGTVGSKNLHERSDDNDDRTSTNTDTSAKTIG